MSRISPEIQFTALVDALTVRLGSPIVSIGDALLIEPGAVPSDPQNAAHQRLYAGTYPWPTTTIGRARVVLVTDIARTLLGFETGGESETPAPAPRRGRGRPRKTAQQAAGGAE